MEHNVCPKFVIKENLQKSSQTGVYFTDQITEEILKDICKKITGQEQFEMQFVDNDYSDAYLPKGYNKGRLAILYEADKVHYISFSEKEIGGRNSSVQSVPTAYNLFFLNSHENKSLYYYFLHDTGNAGTDYQKLMYRLMKTVGFKFLNDYTALETTVLPFNSIEDIIHTRTANAGRNQSNNSTYITKSSANHYEIYGKTYGASKYETSMICYALSHLALPHQALTLYEVCEGNLDELPSASLKVLAKMKNITATRTDRFLEKSVFKKSNRLRSPRYIFNLLARLGNKRCAFCNCEIPELIQGAHVLPVAVTKKMPALTLEERVDKATDGNNGLWLCENHHRLFDEGLLSIDLDGKVNYRANIEASQIAFMDEITLVKELPSSFLTPEFTTYLKMRNHQMRKHPK